MATAKYLGWGRSLLAPRERFLPGLGARLGDHPRMAGAVFSALRRVPGRRLRAAVYRHVSRPLARRMTATIGVLVSGGYTFSVDTGDAFGRTLLTSGVWEPAVTAIFSSLLFAGDVFVDVGAHVGYYTLLASTLVGRGGRVYAIEPAPDVYDALLANLEANGIGNVTPMQVAAGAAEGEAVLGNPDPGQSVRYAIGSRERPNGANATIVPVRPLAALVEPADLDRLRLVKIDVEEYETEVLRGLEPILESGRRPALLIEMHCDHEQAANAVAADLCTRFGLTAAEIVERGGGRFAASAGLRELEPDKLPGEHYHLLLTG